MSSSDALGRISFPMPQDYHNLFILSVYYRTLEVV
jgi:hypothetical protein